jgi:uncharacterized protein YdbL (DUF1318 family)
MLNKQLQLFILCLIFGAWPAYSLELQDAKDQGLVGETPSGYLEAVKSPNAEVRRLIESINAQRKQHYQKIANGNNTTLDAVEKLAGEKAMEKSKAGHYIKPGGQWKQK